MSRGANRDADPFAGYVPVKPAIPVVDGDVPDFPQASRRFRARRQKASGDASRMVFLVVLGVISVTLISIIAAVSCGFIHGRSVGEAAPEFADAAGWMRPLSDFGRGMRAKVGDVLWIASVTNHVSCPSLWGVVAPVETNVVRYVAAEKSAQRFADGETVVGEMDALEKQPVAQPVLLKTGRTVDPALKHFRSNGRKGRAIGQ